ncbi:type II toxin-antitoxin system RelE/ParE family toxin [Candidatus Uhrbacteria bacterium]|nr:type II toxin-antitoxin system RelE/ParE family toxin [Candidatus Uhrbacteria bacterium]
MFRRVITSSAKKTLKRLSVQAQHALLEETEILIEDPFAGERLHGALSFLYSFHFKFENVHYRVAYSVDRDQKLIMIHLVGPRENFYDRLLRMFR